MTLSYHNHVSEIEQRLLVAHNPSLAPTRGVFFEREYAFFRGNVNNARVLVAGSGLGHDTYQLSSHNTFVVGIDVILRYVAIASREAPENAAFLNADFTRLPFRDGSFDAAILNMGTIGNFEDKAQPMRELLRVADKLFLDFYPPTGRGLETRRRMYEEEGWRNVRIVGDRIVSDDGLDSVSINPEEIGDLVRSFGARVVYHPFCDFSLMAEILPGREHTPPAVKVES